MATNLLQKGCYLKPRLLCNSARDFYVRGLAALATTRCRLRRIHVSSFLRFSSIAPSQELLWERAEQFASRRAIIDSSGSFSYQDLAAHSSGVSEVVREILNAKEQERVAFLCPNDGSYSVCQWGIWKSGNVAVPLCKSHPLAELEYVLKDSESTLVIATDDYYDKIHPLSKQLGIPCLRFSSVSTRSSEESNVVGDENRAEWMRRDAMIVYTSGTTGRPKGVVTSHRNISAQIEALIEAWEWSADDVILHVLPLHHVHGIINVLACPLWAGATCYMLPEFNAAEVWKFLIGESGHQINIFMAVPTIYAKLIEHWEKAGWGKDDTMREKIREDCKKIRLMVSGSASLPVPIMRQWEDITGHKLLERYGMTEIGMALTNPLHGKRRPGFVGNPFPRVSCRIVAKDHDEKDEVVCTGNEYRTLVSPGMNEVPGELQIKGPAVFQRYWKRPDATDETFTPDGWFKTGDTCAFENGMYKILGRTSVDIIKSGGYKISALDVERTLLEHEDILECAVVGVEDMVWGQKLGAVLVCRDEKVMTEEELKSWAEEFLPSYKIPRLVKCLKTMPRNAMGKVNKKELVKIFD